MLRGRNLAFYLSCLALLGCATPPPPVAVAPPPAKPDARIEPPAPIPPRKEFQAVFETGLILDYAVETRRSRLDGKSCYAFITGTLENRSSQKLAQKTAVLFRVYDEGALMFEDFANLRMPLMPGNRVQFDFIQSPLHKKQCPEYDKIDVALRRIAQR
jgi:hypothetical protein